jgi:PKD repeat protein
MKAGLYAAALAFAAGLAFVLAGATLAADPSGCDNADPGSIAAANCSATTPIVPSLDPDWSDSFVPPAEPKARAAAATACRPLNAVFYAETDWLRLAQKLRSNPSPCASYYVSVPPLAADKTQLRNGEAAKIRALGSQMHAMAEINITGWTNWVAAGNGSWYDAGVLARQRMAAAGFDVTAGDIWAVNELSSAVRQGTGAARQNMRDLIRGLYTGDGSGPGVPGLVWTVGIGQSTGDLSTYKTNLKAWLPDTAFWTDMSQYVRFWSQEVFGDVRDWAVPGVDLGTRRDRLTDYVEHVSVLAEVSPAAAASANAFLRAADAPLANCAWAYSANYGYTLVPVATMQAYVASQVYALRHYQGGSSWLDGDSFGCAWTPENNLNLKSSDFVSQSAAILDQLAAAIHNSDPAGVSDPGSGACGPDGSACSADVPGAAFNPAWQIFHTWTQPSASNSSATVAEDGTVSIPLVASDADGDALTYQVVTPPAHGTLTGDGAARTYTPAPDFNGSDSFTFTVFDGFMTSRLATVSITVTPVNDNPVVTLAPVGPVDEGAAPVQLTATASDVDGDPLTYTWTTDAGTLTPSGATAAFAASDGPAVAHVSVVVSDGQGGSASAAIVLEVRNVAPAVDPGAAVQAVWGVPIGLSGHAVDPSAADTAAGLAARWDFGDGSPTASGLAVSHAYAGPGAYVATLTVTDKDGGTGTGTTPVTIGPRPAAIAYVGPESFERWTVPVAARLGDGRDAASARLAGHAVSITAGGQSCAATTDATGLARCDLDASPLALGETPVTVSFAGDELYAPVSAALQALVYARAPVIAASSTYVPGAWTAHDVVVEFTCTDEPGGSGVAPGSVSPSSVTVSAEGVQSATSPPGFCADNAGNQAAPLAFGPVDIDRTPPVIDLAAPKPGAVYAEGQKVLASYTCNDALSGVVSCTGPFANGEPLDTSNGPRGLTFTAVDAAGNQASVGTSYTAAAQLGKATDCDRYFTGTGRDVTVPKGETCHLLPGTTVTRDVSVEKGAALKAIGVTIGHDLEASAPGGITVCSSNVAHDLSLRNASGFNSVLGDTTRGGCQQGNTIGHDLLVVHNTAPVMVGDNQVGRNLVVKDNQPGGALVERNSAGQNALCSLNAPQEARGNTAPGRLTCPN